ncbi:MAG: nucleotidyltransferase family protein [Coxiellaceae bacterium]|nr:nucleotidyltransferase family protein [Coxiellaceae bacterium]
MIALNEIEPIIKLTESKALLTKALISDSDTAKPYLQQWIDNLTFDSMDFADFKMIPMLYKKSLQASVNNPYEKRMRGVYKYYYLHNNIKLHAYHKIIIQLINSGVECIAFKGLALTLKYYKNAAVRWSSDADILIGKSKLALALKTLRQHGWERIHSEQHLIDNYIPHSYDCTYNNEHYLDLHYHSLYETPIDGSDTAIRQRAKDFDWNGVNIKIMSPEDLIFTSIVNGLRGVIYWDQEDINIEWMLDIIKIIETEKTIDWDIIFEEAKNRSLLDTLYHGLMILSRTTEIKLFCDTSDKLKQLNSYYFHQLALKSRFNQKPWLQNENRILLHKIARFENEAKIAKHELSSVYNSRTWRWTAIIRKVIAPVKAAIIKRKAES